jgi:menaquinone-dependent protoporphyrinogen oxidase
MVADALREEGFTVEVAPARKVRHLDGCEAVIVGGPLRVSLAHRDARRFIKRHACQLRVRSTYLYSCGPLDDSAARKEIPPVKGVQKLVDSVGARGHVTFGERR